MAGIHILCSVEETKERPYARRDLERLRQAAEADSIKVHNLVEDPEAADLILFVGPGKPGQTDVLFHPHMRRSPEKCYVIDASDRTLPVVPGIYASAERTWLPRSRFRAGFYFRIWENEALQFTEVSEDAPLLFSFIGAGVHSVVRQKILRLQHSRSMLIDTSEIPANERQRDGSIKDEYSSRYAEMIAQSKFILCPRGIGSSSWRLFEAMKAGRAPVIISDAWVPPNGPDWESFSIRLPEARVSALPALLEEHEHRAAQMGKSARAAWESYFSKHVAFHRVVETCLEIRSQRRTRLDLGRLLLVPHLLRPFFLRHWVFHSLKALLKRCA
jgi:hypothetical protein